MEEAGTGCLYPDMKTVFHMSSDLSFVEFKKMVRLEILSRSAEHTNLSKANVEVNLLTDIALKLSLGRLRLL